MPGPPFLNIVAFLFSSSLRRHCCSRSVLGAASRPRGLAALPVRRTRRTQVLLRLSLYSMRRTRRIAIYANVFTARFTRNANEGIRVMTIPTRDVTNQSTDLVDYNLFTSNAALV